MTAFLRMAKPLVFGLAIPVLLLSLVLAGCGSLSPSEVVEKQIGLLNDNEYGELYDMLAPGSPIRQDMTRDEFIEQGSTLLAPGTRLEEFKVTRETVEGDEATVEWSAIARASGVPDSVASATATLIRENGEWKPFY